MTLLFMPVPDISRIIVVVGYLFSAIVIASLSVLVGVGEYMVVSRSSPLPMSWLSVAIVRLLAGGAMFVTLILLALPLEGIKAFSRQGTASMLAFCGVLLSFYVIVSLLGLKVTDGWLRRLAYGMNAGSVGQQWPSRHVSRKSNLISVAVGALPLLILGAMAILRVRN